MPGPPLQAIHTVRDGTVEIIRLDAGKLNVLTPEVATALRAAVDEAVASDDVGAIALLGNERAFSAGLDTATLAAGGDAARSLLRTIGELLTTLYGSSTPVVAGCAGHAVAAGAMVLLVSDARVAAAGSYRVGFTEVAMGLPLPELALVLARERLDPRRLQLATAAGHVFDPNEAAAAGFVDRVVPAAELETAVLSEAGRLAELDRAAYGETIAALRGPALARMRRLVDALR